MAVQPSQNHIDPLTIPFIQTPPSQARTGADTMVMADVIADLGIEPNNQGLRLRLLTEHAQGIVSDAERDRALTSDEKTLEIIIDKSNMLQAWFLEVGVQRARAVCKVTASGTNFQGQVGSWSGTGFLVSPNILLTNHHVLNSAEVASEAVCIFNYQIDASGIPLPTKSFRIKPSRLFLTSPVKDGLDFTFVWVDNSPGQEFGFVPLDRSAFKAAIGEFANIIQHPRGDTKSVVIQENQVTWQDVNVVHYLSDTEPGSSGSCVFNNSWKAVALHHASSNTKDQDTGPAKQPFRNEGIKFSAIAIYLEEVAAGGASQSSAQEILGLFQGTDAMMGFFGSLGREGTPPNTTPTGPEIVVNRYKGEADDIDLAFWNIEWLSRTFQERQDAVARMMMQMNTDVWVFEESSADAANALVECLNTDFRGAFKALASEPGASPAKQTTTVIWNTKTIKCEQRAWPDAVVPWFHIDSRHFAELGLEAVEGPVFDRYPGLHRLTAANRDEGREPFLLYLVPLHLKAMDEGSKHRRMASQILAAAIHKTADASEEADWIVGGDFNAALATDDFRALIGGMVPLSAADEEGGAFSYLKRPTSLIDRIILSPNLARTYGGADYFIVAADREIPGYVRELSDHRPVLVRLTLLDQVARERPRRRRMPAGPEKAALAELRKVLQGNGRPAQKVKRKKSAPQPRRK